MKQEIKKVKVKAYNRKTHVIEVEYFEMSGHKFCYLKKNGNVILNTTPDQLKKLKSLFEQEKEWQQIQSNTTLIESLRN